MALEWSAQAAADLNDIFEFIAKDSPVYPRQFAEAIFTATETLTSFPDRGRRVPEADRDDIRELIYRRYRIIYRTSDNDIHIVAVVHGARDLASLKTMPWDVI